MQCERCKADAKNTCGRCKKVRYCSVNCQKADWPTHKLSCISATATADPSSSSSSSSSSSTAPSQSFPLPALPSCPAWLKSSLTKELILGELQAMSKDARGFRGRIIPTWTLKLTPNDFFFASRSPAFLEACLEFHRTFVSSSQPVVIKGALNHWPALSKWNQPDEGFRYLKDKMGDTPISVAVTPNGRADAIEGSVFCTPCTKKMTMAELFGKLAEPKASPVYYCQQQNNNFHDEFAELFQDVDAEGIEIFNRAFGVPPDAMNIWIGDHRSTTTAHRDHYENIVCQIAGRKTFHLVAPSDAWRLRVRMVSQAAYAFVDEEASEEMELRPQPDAGQIPWIVDAVQSVEAAKWGPLRVTLEPGDVLYLPSLWIHAVTQEPGGPCIGVNFWYDMMYNMHFSTQQAINRFGQMLQADDEEETAAATTTTATTSSQESNQ